jgi:RNA polymerase sigma-70 factor (ECF subfamily)
MHPESDPQVDPAILSILVENHRRFQSFLRPRVNSPEDAEEILQSAFATAAEKQQTIQSHETAVAWFYRLLRNALVDYYRKQDLQSRAFDTTNPQAVDQAVVDVELERTICECLKEVIPTLKSEYSELLQRVDLDRQSVADVAKSLGISPNNVSVRLHRARASLRERLVQTCGTCTIHGCLDCTCKSC